MGPRWRSCLAAAPLSMLMMSACAEGMPPGDALFLQVKLCSSVATSRARLACYDAVAKGSGRSDSRFDPAAAGVLSHWRRASQPGQEGTEAKQVIWSEGVRIDGPDEPNAFYIQCGEGRLATFIDWGTPLAEDPAEITLVLDEGSPRTEILKIFDKRYAGWWNTPEAGIFLDHLNGGNQLLAQTTGADGRLLTLEFDIRGIAMEAQDIRDTCE